MPEGLRLTVNFHPDRLVADAPVVEHLARTGRYLPQFVTGISNGGLTAHPGGARWRWEQRLFGGAYDDGPADERPIYGAVDQARHPLGGAPRFGSAYLLLKPEVADRATFCFPDSVLEPQDFGVADRFALLSLVEEFTARPRTDLDEQRLGGLLDAYIEAQIHGGLLVARDVDALVLDPSFRGTAVEEASSRLGTAVRWHEGRVLHVADLHKHPDYRGVEVVEAGGRIAQDGRLDAAILAQAVADGQEDAQLMKKVWHCIARFGEPVTR